MPHILRCSRERRRAAALLTCTRTRLLFQRPAHSSVPVGALGALALASAALALAVEESDANAPPTTPLLALAHAQGAPRGLMQTSSGPYRLLGSTMATAIEEVYEITDEIIGEGGYCVVHRGVDRRSGEHVAVKILNKTETNAREFWSEVDVLRVAGKHPNIMQLRAVFEAEDCWYIVQDLASDGELFDHLIANGAYSEKQASEAVRDLCDALHYLHRKGIVHGDIKPENILLHDGRMCLVDFGVSFRMGERFIGDSQLTGTVAYAAPETLVYGLKGATSKTGELDDGSERGSPQTIMTDGDGLEDEEYSKLGPKTDMFALGVVLYILLCGCHPFDRYNNLTDDEIRKRIIKGKYHTQSRAWKAISAPARDLICKLLETDPEKRLSSSEALQHPWLVKNAQLSQVPMRNSAELLEKFQRGRRRLRASIIGVLLVDALDEESKSSNGDTVSAAVAQLTKDMSWGISSSVEAFHEKTQALLSTLDIFDKDKKGFISKTDLARVSEKLGKRMSESELNEMLVGSTGDPEHDAADADAIAYEDVKIAISTLRSASYEPGETIIREGYSGGHYVYLLLDGEVEVSCKNPIKEMAKQLENQIFVPVGAGTGGPGSSKKAPLPQAQSEREDEDEIVLRRLPKGSFFGEIELVRPDGQLHPRVATFRCAPSSPTASSTSSTNSLGSVKSETAQCKVLQLVADDFLNVSGTYASINERMGRCARRHTQQQLIKCVEAAKGSIKKRTLQPGEFVYREGEQCDSFFIMLEGEVEVLKQNGTVVVEELHAGDYFPLGVSGQTKQNKISMRHSTVRCTQPTRVVEIGGETFRSFLRSNQFLTSYFHEEVNAREQKRIDKVTKG